MRGTGLFAMASGQRGASTSRHVGSIMKVIRYLLEKSMTAMQRAPWLWGMLAISVGLAACGNTPVHEGESFNPLAPYQYRVPAELDRACEAARLALLSQGYATEEAKTNQLKATKSFQPSDESHSVIEFNVVCAATRKGVTLYTNALEKRYELKKSNKSAGISVSSVGAISLPWGSSNESLIMVASKTIDDPAFYKRYYDLVDSHLGINTAR